MERIYQHYHNKDVEVMTIISGVTDEYSRNRLPSFSQDYKASYTALDDPKNSVVALYALDSTDLRTPQVLIIDKEGIVRHVGKVTPWTQMADEIEQLRGRTEELDLSNVELALQSLKNSDGYVRWKAAEALGKMGDEIGFDGSLTLPLIEALDDKAAGVREFAAKALGEIGDSQAMEPLIDTLEDKSNFVRLEAVKALEGIADERAISPLVKSLKDSELRQNAANALAEIGKPELVDEALENHRSILQRAGTYEFPEAYAQLGHAYKEREMYDAAVAAYEKAAKRASDSYRRRDYARNLVECYMETGEKEKAATEYLSMIKMASAGSGGIFMSHSDGTVEKFSDREWAIRDFIESFQRQGKLGEFSEILETKISELPKDVGLHETLGSIYEKQGINEKAISMYEKVVELQPYNVKNRARLALAYNRAGMADKASAQVKEMAKKGGDASTQSVMAKVFLECEMYDEAVEAYKKAVSMAQGNWDRRGYQLGLAKCYDDAGKYTEAVEEYEKIAKTSTDSYYRDIAERQLWTVYSKGNLYDVAIEKYQKMVEANPKDVKAHEFLAKAYEGKGDDTSAVAEYEKIIQIQPDNAQWYKTLGDLFRKPRVVDSVSDNVLSLDGDGDFVEIADSDALNNLNSQVTMEAWIKPTAFSNEWMSVFFNGDERTPDISNRSYTLWLNRAGSLHLASAPGNTPQIGLDSPRLIKLNNWYHIAGVVDAKNGTMRMFINGNEVAIRDFGSEIRISHLPLRIGWSHEEEVTSHDSFAGLIDEVRIWSVARTQQEIRDNMNVKLAGDEPSLVGYCRFDEKEGEQASRQVSDEKLIGDAKIVKCDRPVFAEPTPDKLAKAVEAYSNAIDLDPNSYELRLLLSQIYLQNEQYEQAADELKPVLNRQDCKPKASVSSANIFPDNYRGIWTSVVEAGKVVKDEARFIQFMQELMDGMPAGSTAQLHANLALSAFYGERNRLEEANGYLNKVGFVAESAWWIIGPFDNAGGNGHHKSYVPEDAANFDATAEYAGKDGNVVWKKLHDNASDGFVDFDQIFGGNLDWVTAYAWTKIISPDERQVQIRFGSDDHAKIWLNGQEVFAFDKDRPAAIDQDVIPVTLKVGENSLLIKVSDERVNWGFYLRFTDMNGVPVDDLGLMGD